MLAGRFRCRDERGESRALQKSLQRWEMDEDSVDGCGMVMMLSVDERRQHQEDKVRERDDVFLLVLATGPYFFSPESIAV